MLDSLQFGVMLAESGMLEEAVREVMMRPQLMMIAESSPGIQTSMKNQVSKWKSQIRSQLGQVTIEEKFAEEIALYQQSIELDSAAFVQQVDDLLIQLSVCSAFYHKANELAAHPHHRYSPMFQSYFCNQWFESIAQELNQAQLNELKQHKQALLADLYQRVDTLKAMPEMTESGDSSKLGRLWDMAAAKLSKNEVNLLQQFAVFLKGQKGLQKIAEQLGRMADQVIDPNSSNTPVEETQLVEEQLEQVTDDIVGIHEGDDLAKLLPNETMFLAYPELEVIFYKHLVDHQLLNYQMKGKQRKLRKVKTYKKAAEQTMLDKGPFILAIDSSGSMEGFPEKCAKAMAYGLMQIALAEERDCYVIMFSTELITYELTKKDGLREVLNFLAYSFHGGTDMPSALEKAIEQMLDDKYKNADLVVLSDFIAPAPPAALLTKIEQLKAQKNRFHALNLSNYGNPQLMEIFDHLWDYTRSPIQRLFKR
ncbi:ATPase RavA stimulator ViaA [Agarivorans sp. MS3-6]|uniref:ATPase RavA stimulator ViaA n=1 Tax=Agarivorans sp. TSD2052 TaxID=2937286 RepID=UPI00200CE310|nr:ATPase RavA stimulator ViaA [Agarivorans sp. TSD2052]UPW18629.1 ATPase RavA stimulator ViaA [Agarivorans sp. TSD2052]